MSDACPDQVSVDMGAGHNFISLEKWLSLPVGARTKLLLENKVRFLKGARILPVREALVALKKLRETA